jgi:hypothetical protein
MRRVDAQVVEKRYDVIHIPIDVMGSDLARVIAA